MLKKTNKPLAEGMHVGTIINYQPKEEEQIFVVTYLVDKCHYDITIKASIKEGKTMSQLDVWVENLATYYWEEDSYAMLDRIIKDQIPVNLEKKGNYPLDLKKKDYQVKPKETEAAPAPIKRA